MESVLVGLALAVVLSTGSAQASENYNCVNTQDRSSGAELRLVIGNQKAVIKNGGASYVGTLDATYRPRQLKGYVRYIGFQGYSEEYQVELLVQKKILRTARRGYIRVLARGETFETEIYVCTLEE